MLSELATPENLTRFKAKKTSEGDLVQAMENLSVSTLKIDMAAVSSVPVIANFVAYLWDLKPEICKRVAEKMKKFSDFEALKTDVAQVFPSMDFSEEFKALKSEVNKKFKILVLMDLNESIFFRTQDRDIGKKVDFQLKRYKYFFRPRYSRLLHTLGTHERVTFAFYSSMMRANITPVLLEVCSSKPKLEQIKSKIGIFDREHCSFMNDHKYYKELVEEKWDTYRDLNKIFADPFCKSNGFDAHNTLLVDSSNEKV
jgi:hypothetical protein